MSAPPANARQAAADVEWIRRRGFAEFVRRAWPQVEPAPLVWSWHLDAICEHLEAVARREIRDLVINIPPGTSKSMLSSVLWPAWVWSLDPARRFIFASYAERVVLRDARKNRRLVDSEWFQARWPEVVIPRDRTASTALSIFNTSQEGMRFSTTIPGGDVVGQHCHDMGVDDPINPQLAGAASGVGIDAVLEWWSNAPGRFLDHATSTRTLTMQRVHERDLTVEFRRAGATVLCLPMRFERAHPLKYEKDPRTEEGELLCPARIPPEEVDRIERVMGPTKTAAQHQQRPAPAGGNIVKVGWTQRRWVALPESGTWGLSIDAAFKDTQASSYVVIQAWLSAGANHYLVDQHRERMSFVETLKALIEMGVRYPDALLKLVEDKANGPAILSILGDKVPGLVPVSPGSDSKEARLRATEPLWAAGNVWLPDTERAQYPDGRVGAPWVPEYVQEITTFPGSAANDQVDATSQYLNHAAANGLELMEAAMNNMQNLFGGLG